jgi:hypothetical protein
MKFSLPLVFVSMAGSCFGVVINFDFNLNNNTDDSNVVADTHVGLAAAPDSAGASAIWNSVRRSSSNGFSSNNFLNTHVGATSTPTVTSTGLATTASVTVTSGGGTGLVNAHIGQTQLAAQQELGLGAYTDLMGDFIVVDSDTGHGTVGTAYGTIEGLAANSAYEIYFYGQGASNSLPGTSGSGQNSLFGILDAFGVGGTLVGSTKQTGYDGTPGGNGTLTENVEFVKFAVQTNASGQIFFVWQNVVSGPGGNVTTDNVPNGVNAGSRAGALNAIQIVSVPEPSTTLLGGLGMLALLARRCRTK